jgi:hypothetical protein
MGDNVYRADARIGEDKRIKPAGYPVKHFAGQCTEHCPWPSRLQKSGVTLGAKDTTDDQKLVYGTVMCSVRYDSEREQFVQCVGTWDETWVNQAIRETSNILA